MNLPHSRAAVARALQSLVAESDTPVGVLLLDLRQLARLNEVYGYAKADACLATLTTALEALREDKGGVFWLGGGQWLCPVRRVTHPSLLELAGTRLLESLPGRIDLDDLTVMPRFVLASASTGEDCTTGERLLLHAEQALRHAKQQFRPYLDYRDVPAHLKLESWRIEAELYEAFRANALEVWFQPQVHLQRHQIVGAEALLRWESETRGPVSPEVFIPLLEHSGFVLDLTKWLFNASFRQAADWLHQNPEHTLSINLSGNFVNHEELVTLATNSVAIWNVPPSQVILEVTESSMLWDWEHAIDNLERLRVAGFGVSLDDFGTGYSSLLYFKDLPATELKIDKVFVEALNADPESTLLIETLVRLAHGFGMETLAEGVESQAQVRQLAQLGVDTAQGWYFSPALPVNEFLDWIARWSSERYFKDSSS